MKPLGFVCLDLLGSDPNGALLAHLPLLEGVLLVVGWSVEGVSVTGVSVISGPSVTGGTTVTSVFGTAPLLQKVTIPWKLFICNGVFK